MELFEHRHLLAFEPASGICIRTGLVGLAFYPWKTVFPVTLETPIYTPESNPSGLSAQLLCAGRLGRMHPQALPYRCPKADFLTTTFGGLAVFSRPLCLYHVYSSLSHTVKHLGYPPPSWVLTPLGANIASGQLAELQLGGRIIKNWSVNMGYSCPDASKAFDLESLKNFQEL